MTNPLYLFNCNCNCDYQKAFLPNYWQCKRQWLFLFVDKKIEIWHYLIRAQSYNDATAIEKVARTLATSGFLTNFWAIFVPKYMRGKSNFDYWMMVGKSAEFMLQDLIFSEIVKHMKGAHVVSIAEVDKRLILFSVLILRQFLLIIYCTTLVPGDCTSNGKSKSWAKFQFPTFGVTAESKCIPLAYNLSIKDLSKEPKLQLYCNLPPATTASKMVLMSTLLAFTPFIYHAY